MYLCKCIVAKTTPNVGVGAALQDIAGKELSIEDSNEVCTQIVAN